MYKYETVLFIYLHIYVCLPVNMIYKVKTENYNTTIFFYTESEKSLTTTKMLMSFSQINILQCFQRKQFINRIQKYVIIVMM